MGEGGGEGSLHITSQASSSAGGGHERHVDPFVELMVVSNGVVIVMRLRRLTPRPVNSVNTTAVAAAWTAVEWLPLGWQLSLLLLSKHKVFSAAGQRGSHGEPEIPSEADLDGHALFNRDCVFTFAIVMDISSQYHWTKPRNTCMQSNPCGDAMWSGIGKGSISSLLHCSRFSPQSNWRCPPFGHFTSRKGSVCAPAQRC